MKDGGFCIDCEYGMESDGMLKSIIYNMEVLVHCPDIDDDALGDELARMEECLECRGSGGCQSDS